MRELYKSGRSPSPSGSASSIVAKAVAKIEQDKLLKVTNISNVEAPVSVVGQSKTPTSSLGVDASNKTAKNSPPDGSKGFVVISDLQSNGKATTSAPLVQDSCNSLEQDSKSDTNFSELEPKVTVGDQVTNKCTELLNTQSADHNLDKSFNCGVDNKIAGGKTAQHSPRFPYQRLQESNSPYDFETALEDFDRTAEEVLNFVQERSDHLLSSAQNTPKETSNTNSSKSPRKKSDSDSDDSDSDDSTVSSKNERVIANDGLATITEECGAQSTTTSFDGESDDSEVGQDAIPIQFCKPVEDSTSGTNNRFAGPLGSDWIDIDDGLSTTDTEKSSPGDISTETEDQNGTRDSSTRCNADFQWIRKDPVQNATTPLKANNNTMDSDEEIDRTSATSSGNNNSNPNPLKSEQPHASHSKPPINHHRPLQQPSNSRQRRSQANQPQAGHSLGSSPEKALSPNSNCSTGGSLDRRRYHNHSHDRNNRYDRDQRSRSQHLLKSPPLRLEDYTMKQSQHRDLSPSLNPHHFHNPYQSTQYCQNWCCSQNHNPPNPFMVDQQSNTYQPIPQCNQHPHQPQQRRSVDRFGSSPILVDSRGSHPDLYRPHHDGCCQYHNLMVPPLMGPPIGGCCGYHWLQPISPIVKPGDLDDKCRKLQSERDNLQLQVQVLSEQIEAQSEKILDLEKRLGEKKQVLSNTEDLLQRETLSRSSLETQKLELISQISELKLHQASIERENLELRCHYNNNSDRHQHGNRKQVPAYLHRMSPQPTLTSTPVHQSNVRVPPSPSSVTTSNVASPTRQHDSSPKTPPATYKRHIELHYSSLPRQQYLSNGGSFTLANTTCVQAQQHATTGSGGSGGLGALQCQRGATAGGFGRLLLSQYSGVRGQSGLRHKGHSVPNLAETEKITIDDNSTSFALTDCNNAQQQSLANINNNNAKNKGLKKMFGKMKRSSSGNLEDSSSSLGTGEFQRGGVRATASPRLGWSEPAGIIKKPIPTKPFADYDTVLLCEWLSDLGLDQYVPEARRWLKSGQQLQEASIVDYEKELQMKSALHRKKLQLALIDAEANGSSDTLLAQAGKLDTAWVLRWLDDVGLPQYKEAFLQQRIDGRVLHRLTMDDLTTLHVTSALHAASLRRGIQILREYNYDPSCLQRRGVEDYEEIEDDRDKDDGGGDEEDGSSTKINRCGTPQQISLWTSHRVMQWLRDVDLAEYAPNLRGAGVHGAVMVLEQRFTADLLAALLSIPPSKTLLRRHLNTRFKELLGAELIQRKREMEGVLGYVALTPQAKLKLPKKSHFSLKRSKSKTEADYGDLVCPMNATGQSGQDLNGSAINNSSMGMTRKIREKDEDAYQHEDHSNSYPQSAANSPLPLRYESS